MIWEEVYQILAIELAACLSDSPNDLQHAGNALYGVASLSSYGEGSESSYGAEASVALLNPMNVFLNYVGRNYAYGYQIRDIVIIINDFTIKYYGDLTNFVNNLPWEEGCIPYYWAQLSEDCFYDTSQWNVCSLS
jgi:hypothetical protein